MVKFEERLDDFVESYKKDWLNTLHEMKEYYIEKDELWIVIEVLLDKIVELDKE